jgi:hypothetical protein
MHDCLFVHFHGSTMAFQSHAVTGLESQFCQGWVTDQIHSGLAIQENNHLEVKFDPGAMHLFEEFGNVQSNSITICFTPICVNWNQSSN